MSEKLQAMMDLQQQDSLLDKLSLAKEKIPQQMCSLDGLLLQTKQKIEEIKKEFSQKTIEKKNKELEVASRDEQVRKHQSELNVVKSNDAYRALLLEIEKSRQEKDLAEEAVLVLMVDLDDVTAKLKNEEQRLKDEQKDVAEKKLQLEKDLAQLTEELLAEEGKRKDLAAKISFGLLSSYEKIRKAKGGVALAVVQGEVCGGCRMILPHNLINEARKGVDLVYCENCSRILYWLAAPPLQSK